MQIITMKASIPIKIDNVTIKTKEGFKYIVPNHLGQSLENSPYISIQDLYNTKEITQPVDFTGKRILVLRTGGFGDFVFIARSLIEIKKKFKNTYIEFAVSPRFDTLIKNCFMPEIVDECSYIFLPYTHYEKADYFITFEGFIENNKIAYTSNVYNLIASQKFHIDIGIDHTVPFKIPKKYEELADEISKTWDFPVIGMQIKASAILRTYPYPYQNTLIKLLGKKGFKILLIDKESTIEKLIQEKTYDEEALQYIIKPYTKDIKGDLLLSMALVKKCKLLIAPDSFFVYVGDSFNIPTIAFYTPINSACRAIGLNIYAIDVIGGCENCQKHTPSPCHWTNDSWSPCLKTIFPEYVYYIIEEILENKY